MSIHAALHHVSRYSYDHPVTLAPQVIRLRPAPHCRTPVLSYSLKITPEEHFVNWQQDPFGNYLARIVFPEKTNHFVVETDLIAEMAVYNPFDFFLEKSAEDFPFTYEPGERKNLKPFLEAGAQGPLFEQLLASVDQTPQRTTGFLVALNARLNHEIRYVVRLEPGVQTPEETLALGSGSCRDSAWLLVQLLRRLGLAARFASGYLIQLTADVKALDGPVGALHDFTDLHAWCEVYLPGAGWVGLDPTSGLFAGEGHIPLACTPEPSSAAPITGAVDACEAVFTHEMRVTRVLETPRVTKPYTPGQWVEIDALGRQIDAELDANDVRLTMGGEPTFISIDNMEGQEWNFAAVGPEKRGLSEMLLRRMRQRFAPGGLLHFGQGKWYPGESLPRWAYGCYWRKDGIPIWQDEAALASDSAAHGHTEREAEQFIRRLAHLLEIGQPFIQPAYEDAWDHLLRERRLPVNVDPLQSRLENAEERARLAKVFDQGLGKIVGYALPLAHKAGKWESGLMFLRREHCFLIPGDSPMGLRLPLDSLPWAAPSDIPIVAPPDPFAELLPLPEEDAAWRTHLRKRAAQLAATAPKTKASPQKPRPQESAASLVRTTLCVEPRNGALHVFMPPVETTEAYLRLIAAVEETARSLRLPVIVEGEPPPHDPRLNQIKITPDPGVIEVNIHPAASWQEMVAHTTTVYEEARLSRLGTEKFRIDGRHTGTGGGNHIVIGGATAADSPLLRRPDLLRSLLCFWQNHPSLSFLFSGLFIGPTSQHPRVDEARNDALYELEIAFDQIPENGEVPPWLVDRLFRNLLTDASGNTHRAEFCIDKLYDPMRSSGRLGLLELRAFEMPPHAQMSLTQALLLRALVSRFWKTPYRKPLVRWGTQLHDRFMLPHFVEEDFRDVLEDLCQAGYPLRLEWFAPHLEFRFPKYGEITQRGIHLELRQALEPWHVLGEESSGGGTVRYVDSSLERLQIKVRGLVNSRYSLSCNGSRVPLHPTGAGGEYVAGVRLRAWQPPECLHPTIAVHAPLVFDFVDHWNQRSIGGCTYHVAHPGGLSYEKLPINSFEAESRRLSRFTPFGGHTPGLVPTPNEITNREFPFTLDLRMQR